jgi:hypothetical protein
VKATPARRSLFQLAPWTPSTDETASGLWPTVRASDGERGGRGDLIQACRGNENKHFKLWPTPTVDDSNNVSRQSGQFQSLTASVKGSREMFPTPTRQDASNNGGTAQMERNALPLNAVIGGSLNPTWVEWLMGYPLGWTDLKDSETPSSPKSPPRSSRKSSKSTTGRKAES